MQRSRASLISARLQFPLFNFRSRIASCASALLLFVGSPLLLLFSLLPVSLNSLKAPSTLGDGASSEEFFKSRGSIIKGSIIGLFAPNSSIWLARATGYLFFDFGYLSRTIGNHFGYLSFGADNAQ